MSYSPVLGRFIQRDPLAYVDGGSLYQYERSTSQGFTDPTGKNVYTWGAGGLVLGGVPVWLWWRRHYSYPDLSTLPCTCAEVKSEIQNLQNALTALNIERSKAVDVPDLIERLKSHGVYIVGTTDLGVTGAGKGLSACHQAIIARFESPGWNRDHPDAGMHPGGVHVPADIWADSESRRLGIVMAELNADVDRRKKCGECK